MKWQNNLLHNTKHEKYNIYYVGTYLLETYYSVIDTKGQLII